MNPTTIRQAFVLCTALVVVGGNLAAGEAAKSNILVILADDLGWGELSCQGFTQQIPTPNIDSSKKSGVRFTSGSIEDGKRQAFAAMLSAICNGSTFLRV